MEKITSKDIIAFDSDGGVILENGERVSLSNNKKRVYVAFNINDMTYYVGFYSSQYASRHFNAVAKNLGLEVNAYTLCYEHGLVNNDEINNIIRWCHTDGFKLLNKNSNKVNAYIWHKVYEDENNPEIRLLREIFCDKIYLKDIR